MEVIDVLLSGSIVIGVGCIGVMFAGYFSRYMTKGVEPVAEVKEARSAAKAMKSPAVLVVSEASFQGDVTEVVELGDLSIRELKKLASGGVVKNYSKMTKGQLIEALRGVV